MLRSFPLTVNSKIFARVYFHETLLMRSFVKITPSRNGEMTLSFTDIGKYALIAIFTVANMSINAIRENKILAKISKFTVIPSYL